jgi:hypothetical protein
MPDRAIRVHSPSRSVQSTTPDRRAGRKFKPLVLGQNQSNADTPQALNAMRENPNTDRRAAVTQMLEAAGGKVIEMYGISGNGPGAMVIFRRA